MKLADHAIAFVNSLNSAKLYPVIHSTLLDRSLNFSGIDRSLDVRDNVELAPFDRRIKTSQDIVCISSAVIDAMP
jgi:hypothetical protein